MLLESLLAYAHFVAILSVVVFITSEAALCRAEWLECRRGPPPGAGGRHLPGGCCWPSWPRVWRAPGGA